MSTSTASVLVDSRVFWVEVDINSLRLGRDYFPLRRIVCKWLAGLGFGLTLRTAACILLVVVTPSSIVLLV